MFVQCLVQNYDLDPWCSLQSEDSSAVNRTSDLDFEDKFVERFNRGIIFEKLPDSAEFLQNLEAKLSKLITARQSQASTSKRTALSTS